MLAARGYSTAALAAAGAYAVLSTGMGILGVWAHATHFVVEAALVDQGTHFALIALENPDGYALHRELRAHAPEHMHHAARYTALGDDVEFREQAPFFEREARHQALALCDQRTASRRDQSCPRRSERD